MALGGFKLEDRFDRVRARPCNQAGCGPMGINPEASRIGTTDMRFQLAQNDIQAADGSNVPSQGEYIAPMAFMMKQGLEQDVVGFGKRLFELRKPIRRNRCDGFCSRQHLRSQTIELRGASRLIEWRMSLSENRLPLFRDMRYRPLAARHFLNSSRASGAGG